MLGNIYNMLFGPYLYWYAMKRPDKLENYGDIIGPYLYTKITGKTPKHYSKVRPFKLKRILPHYITIGSVMSQVKLNSVVWGSGIIKKQERIQKGKFLAVRGLFTRERLLQLGYDCPEIYGDPALLMPFYFDPKVNKKYKIGIIPHYVDYTEVAEVFKEYDNIKVINLLTHNIEATTIEILECQYIASTSLHGLIISNAYNIPSLWFKISNKLAGDDVKFLDYFSSVDIPYYQPLTLNDLKNINSYDVSCFKKIDESKLKQVQLDLLSVCPFK